VLGPRRDDGRVGNYYSRNLQWLQAECADGFVFAEEMRRVRADRSLGGLSFDTEHQGGWEGGLSV
jgi:hypothetical protein